ncbi:uncharacterized protein LOC104585413 isoform X2 [Brachypodium distachyon]|uniref:uncharacterized protein LOC104585413 isoform X2 n=1 Tax=Brachypodium distachyon TaxID=15368 RepID=UPI00052FF76E|nr:uncharacterized protein LOC104585413 isoform X2 [Brachypodium distachyon]|eukprot:XP_024312016.1 uncharacterized protein LOC104585413 isoform X2 [Brachypodium distachyon]
MNSPGKPSEELNYWCRRNLSSVSAKQIPLIEAPPSPFMLISLTIIQWSCLTVVKSMASRHGKSHHWMFLDNFLYHLVEKRETAIEMSKLRLVNLDIDCVTKLDHHLFIYVYYQGKQEESVISGHAVKRTRGEWGGLNGALGTGNQVGADIEEGAGRKLRARERKESCGQVEEEEEEECLAVKRTRGDGGGINVATGAWRGQAGADTDKGHETKPGAGEQKRSCGQEGEVEEEKEVSGPGGSSITVKHTPVDGGDLHISDTLRTKNLQGAGAGREPGKQPSMEHQKSYGQEDEEEKEEVGPLSKEGSCWKEDKVKLVNEVGAKKLFKSIVKEVSGPGGSSITVKHTPVDGGDLHISDTLRTKNLQGAGAGREPGKQPSMEHQKSYGQEDEEEKEEVGLLSKEVEKKPFKSIVKNATSEQPGGKLLLSRYHQGLGACLEQIRLNESLENLVPALRSAMKYSRRRATIMNLPKPWVEKILENLMYPDLCRAVSSSYFFLRVSMSPCHCGAFIKHSSFLAAIVQPTALVLLSPQGCLADCWNPQAECCRGILPWPTGAVDGTKSWTAEKAYSCIEAFNISAT